MGSVMMAVSLRMIYWSACSLHLLSVRLFKPLSHARGLRRLRSKKRRFQIHNSHVWNDKVGEWLLIAVISKGSGTFGKLSVCRSHTELRRTVDVIKKKEFQLDFDIFLNACILQLAQFMQNVRICSLHN